MNEYNSGRSRATSNTTYKPHTTHSRPVSCSGNIAIKNQVISDPSIYGLNLDYGPLAEASLDAGHFVSTLTMTYNSSFPAPYLRAYAADNSTLSCDVTYARDAAAGRSSASCDVTGAATRNETVRLSAEAYLPPNYVINTTHYDELFDPESDERVGREYILQRISHKHTRTSLVLSLNKIIVVSVCVFVFLQF